MKLKLQEQEYVPMQSHLLMFTPYSEDAGVSIRQLKLRFEQLGVNAKKALLVARFLIEPKETKQQTAADYAATVVLNEDLERTQKGIVDDLYDLVGPYKIFVDSDTKLPTNEDNEDDAALDYANESDMRRKVAEKFSRCKTTLMESLGCEDYGGEGYLDFVQLKEAILAVSDESGADAPNNLGIDQHLLDYMLWYVYSRSETVEKMEYKALMQLIVDEDEKKVTAPAPKKAAGSEAQKKEAKTQPKRS